jgi:hypothetical protein
MYPCRMRVATRSPFSGHGDDVFERLAADKAVDVSGNIA